MRLNTLYPVCPIAARPNWKEKSERAMHAGTVLCAQSGLVEDYGSKRKHFQILLRSGLWVKKGLLRSPQRDHFFNAKARWTLRLVLFECCAILESEWWTLLLKRWQNGATSIRRKAISRKYMYVKHQFRSQSLLTSYDACSTKTNAVGGTNSQVILIGYLKCNGILVPVRSSFGLRRLRSGTTWNVST